EGLLVRGTRCQAREHAEHSRLAVLKHPVTRGIELAVHGGERPHLEGETGHGSDEAIWSDADNGVEMAIDANGGTDYGRIMAIVADPESMADHDNGMGILCIATLGCDEEATGFRAHAQQIEKRAGDQFGAELLDGAVVADCDGHGVAHRKRL